jgi:hypothetical protein
MSTAYGVHADTHVDLWKVINQQAMWPPLLLLRPPELAPHLNRELGKHHSSLDEHVERAAHGHLHFISLFGQEDVHHQ